MSEAQAPARASDLPTRLVAGLVMAGAACLIVWFGGWPLRILILAGAAVMLVEWGDMHRVARAWSWLGGTLLAVLLIGVGQWLYPIGQNKAEFDPSALAPTVKRTLRRTADARDVPDDASDGSAPAPEAVGV